MSKIEWTEKTWSPITGCSPVSDGCCNCYAHRMAHRIVAMEKGRLAKNPGTKLSGYPHDDPFRVTFHPNKLDAPLHWKKPRRVFVCSMGDLFHESVSGPKINEIWNVMFNTPQHIYQVLTKRPGRMKWWAECAARHKQWPINEIWPSHIWLGVSVENQRTADERIPILLQIPAAVRFVSVEPMLEKTDLRRYFLAPTGVPPHHSVVRGIYKDGGQGISWCICGGESGPGRRPFKLDWARDLRDQCKAAGAPFFIKQVDKVRPIPDDLMIREYPK